MDETKIFLFLFIPLDNVLVSCCQLFPVTQSRVLCRDARSHIVSLVAGRAGPSGP